MKHKNLYFIPLMLSHKDAGIKADALNSKYQPVIRIQISPATRNE